MKIKQWLRLTFSVMISIVLLVSCNHDNEPATQTFPILVEYEPVYIVFNKAELTPEELAQMPTLSLVIDSEEDFPKESLPGLRQLKESNIDFDKNTLLLNYEKLAGLIKSHQYGWLKDLRENKFIFRMYFINQQEESSTGEENNIFTYYRTAVLVKKIPENSNVEFWYSVSQD